MSGAPNVVAGMQINIIGDATPFAKAMDQANAIAKRQAKAIKDALNKEIQDSNRTLAIFGEGFGIVLPRQLRTFVSELPGVSKAMSAAFNTVAVFALVDVLVRAAERGKELIAYFEKAGKAAGEFTQAAQALNRPLADNNDELALTLARVQNTLALLEGKPRNGVAEALAEATVQADKLNQTLSKSVAEYANLMKSHDISKTEQILTGTKGTKQAKDIEGYIQDALSKLPNDASYNDKAAAVYREAINRANYEKKNNYASLETPVMGVKVLGDSGKIAAANSALDTLITQAQNSIRTIGLTSQIEAAQKKVDDINRNNAATQRSNELERQQSEFRQRQVEAQRSSITENLEIDPATGRKRTLDQQMSFLNGITPYGENRNLLAQRMSEIYGKLQSQTASIAVGGSIFANFDRSRTQNPHEQVATMAELARISGELSKNEDEVNKKRTDWEASTGQVTRHAAALQTASDHTAEYQKQLAELNAQRDILGFQHTTGQMTDDQYLTASAKNSAQIQTLQNNHSLQAAMDDFNTSMESARTGFQKFFTDFANDAADTAKMVDGILNTAKDGFNDAATAAIMGHNKSQNWSKAFGATGESMIKGSLTKAEALGGSAAKPLYTWIVNGGGAVQDSTGQFPGMPIQPNQKSMLNLIPGYSMFHSLFSSGTSDIPMLPDSTQGTDPGIFAMPLASLPSILPGFASGGDPDPYKASIVGEKGPELFVPHGVSGTVIPNNKLGGGKQPGGDTYNIDATGTNAAEVNMRVKAGMQIAYQQAVQNSQQSMREHNRRVPSSRRS